MNAAWHAEEGSRPRYPAERISVFDIFKIGVGPSSSHTMGPWRAAQRFARTIEPFLEQVDGLEIHLYGSLAKTGKGHGTDFATVLGLECRDPETEEIGTVVHAASGIRGRTSIFLCGRRSVPFSYAQSIHFHREEALDYHPNGMQLTAKLRGGDESTGSAISEISRRYFSIGGGFIVEEGVDEERDRSVAIPFPVDSAGQLLDWCQTLKLSVSQVVRQNMEQWHGVETLRAGLRRISEVMTECVYSGICSTEQLPGGLGVHRRAPRIARMLLGEHMPENPGKLVDAICAQARRVSEAGGGFEQVTRWVSCFALAVNEQNAGFGRVVTAPTNGAAGVIPAVLLYYRCFLADADDEGVERFLLTAGDVGSLFKKGATISAAMGGCQAEIGVSSAMAAAGLTEVSGGSPEQVLQAAEIAMEHHLGMTCDPVGGLVQIPCIERNTMGAIKAITASNIALAGDPREAVVSLDRVIETMWDTARDMSDRYKETSEGGLAVHIPINVIEC